MNVPAAVMMDSSQFQAWCLAHPEGRFELENGRLIEMSPERSVHNLTKLSLAICLKGAVNKAGADCKVYTDGLWIKVSEGRIRQPDASVVTGKGVARDSIWLENPLVIAEVVSPSSDKTDSNEKLADYATLPTLQHYLVVEPDHKVIFHYQRTAKAQFNLQILHEGRFELSPPGIELSVEEILGDT